MDDSHVMLRSLFLARRSRYAPSWRCLFVIGVRVRSSRLVATQKPSGSEISSFIEMVLISLNTYVLSVVTFPTMVYQIFQVRL